MKIKKKCLIVKGSSGFNARHRSTRRSFGSDLGKFNIDEVLRQAKDLRSVFVEGLGEVRYVLLSEADISEIAKKYPDDARERNLQALFRSMAAADSEITLEKLRSLPYDVSRVLQETVLNASFLPPKKTSKPGLTAAANFKASS